MYPIFTVNYHPFTVGLNPSTHVSLSQHFFDDVDDVGGEPVGLVLAGRFGVHAHHVLGAAWPYKGATPELS